MAALITALLLSGIRPVYSSPYEWEVDTFGSEVRNEMLCFRIRDLGLNKQKFIVMEFCSMLVGRRHPGDVWGSVPGWKGDSCSMTGTEWVQFVQAVRLAKLQLESESLGAAKGKPVTLKGPVMVEFAALGDVQCIKILGKTAKGWRSRLFSVERAQSFLDLMVPKVNAALVAHS